MRLETADELAVAEEAEAVASAEAISQGARDSLQSVGAYRVSLGLEVTEVVPGGWLERDVCLRFIVG